jgi:hypothetical protein
VPPLDTQPRLKIGVACPGILLKLVGRRILHDFRRTAARSYRRAGVSEGVIMQIGGWRTRSVFERYNIKNQRDLQEAAVLVAQLREGQTENGGKMASNRGKQALQATDE